MLRITQPRVKLSVKKKAFFGLLHALVHKQMCGCTERGSALCLRGYVSMHTWKLFQIKQSWWRLHGAVMPVGVHVYALVTCAVCLFTCLYAQTVTDKTKAVPTLCLENKTSSGWFDDVQKRQSVTKYVDERQRGHMQKVKLLPESDSNRFKFHVNVLFWLERQSFNLALLWTRTLVIYSWAIAACMAPETGKDTWVTRTCLLVVFISHDM